MEDAGEHLDEERLMAQTWKVKCCQFCGRDTKAQHGICNKCLGERGFRGMERTTTADDTEEFQDEASKLDLEGDDAAR